MPREVRNEHDPGDIQARPQVNPQTVALFFTYGQNPQGPVPLF